MILKKMNFIEKLTKITLVFFLLSTSLLANEDNFESWLVNFKKIAVQKGISQKTVNYIMKDVKFIDKVIVYDNRQPEFFQKTKVYISKRSTNKAVKIAKAKYLINKEIFTKVEKDFKVEKELLLALWSIETNFGNYFGKMDIVSSLATLSYDKRRSKFFTEELLILLKLVDKKILTKEMLYGSWAGAIGNFQFMPSTVLNYGIDYDNDGKIDLKKSLPDSIASAANYMNKVGWKHKDFCFQRVNFTKTVDKKYFNHSARNIKNKKNSSYWNKIGIIDYSTKKKIILNNKTSLVLPDGDSNSPRYLTSDNYEKILKWNRSLRFALSVCTLKNMIKNEL
jgi:membrane-bound lytic murein transglycosylase B